MKKIGFFGLVLAFMAMAIFIVSCSQPLYPDGSTWPAGSEYDWYGEDIPGWDTDGSGPCGRKTVAEQLEWLHNYAPADTHWNVWAWMTPHETIGTTQEIHGDGGPGTAIAVNLRTYSGYTGLVNRRTLLTGGTGDMTMLRVQGDSRLYLGNIILQGRSSNNAALVIVDEGKLEKRNNSEIRGNTGNSNAASVFANAGATFTMRGNSLITGGTRGVNVDNADFYMRANARITATNGTPSVNLINGSTLIMSNYAHISGSPNVGVSSWGSTIRMYNNAQISHNGRIAINPNWGISLNNNSNLIMRNNAQVHSNGATGVRLNGSRLFMYENAEIHNNTSTSSAVNGGVSGIQHSSIYMYGNASIHNNNFPNGGGVVLTIGNNKLNMHGNARIHGNNSNNEKAGGVYLSSTSELNISGGTIYGRYVSPGNLQQPPELRNTGANFHALQSSGVINIVEYDLSSSNFGLPGITSGL